MEEQLSNWPAQGIFPKDQVVRLDNGTEVGWVMQVNSSCGGVHSETLIEAERRLAFAGWDINFDLRPEELPDGMLRESSEVTKDTNE